VKEREKVKGVIDEALGSYLREKRIKPMSNKKKMR